MRHQEQTTPQGEEKDAEVHRANVSHVTTTYVNIDGIIVADCDSTAAVAYVLQKLNKH